jgi:hypothetical protein
VSIGLGVGVSNFDQHERSLIQWAGIVGHWKFGENGMATYLRPEPGQRPFGICVSSVRFSEGEIRMVFCQHKGVIDGRILLGFRSPEDEYFAIGLGGYGKAYTITYFSPKSGWQEVAGFGRNEDLIAGQSYRIAVRLEGQRICLDVDGICVIDKSLEIPIPYGQVGLFSWGESGTAEFASASVKRRPSDIEQVVILVHGIRTHAEWQAMLHQEFSRVGISVAPTNYGYFDLVRFILPVPWFRKAATDRVWNLVREVRRDYPKAKLSFLAHSFGTYLVAQILKREFDFKAHRIVFCGSVVTYNFPFEQIPDRLTWPIVNEVSARDPWPVIAQNITFGYGAVGARGFNRHRVHDRWYQGFGHSQYLTQSFCQTFLIPFFERGEIVNGAAIPEKAPWWLRLLYLFTDKYFIATALVIFIVLWPYI